MHMEENRELKLNIKSVTTNASVCLIEKQKEGTALRKPSSTFLVLTRRMSKAYSWMISLQSTYRLAEDQKATQRTKS